MGSPVRNLYANGNIQLAKSAMKVFIIALANAKPQDHLTFSGDNIPLQGDVVGKKVHQDPGSNPIYEAGSNPSIPTYQPGSKHFDVGGNTGNIGNIGDGDQNGGSKSTGSNSSASGGGGAGK